MSLASMLTPTRSPPSTNLPPSAEEAIAALKKDGITRLVVLPLYPQFSVSTSGSSLRLLEKLLKEDPALAKVSLPACLPLRG